MIKRSKNAAEYCGRPPGPLRMPRLQVNSCPARPYCEWCAGAYSEDVLCIAAVDWIIDDYWLY